jgi:hypothetical protein
MRLLESTWIASSRVGLARGLEGLPGQSLDWKQSRGLEFQSNWIASKPRNSSIAHPLTP